MALGALKTSGLVSKSRFVLAIDPGDVSSTGVTVARCFDYQGNNTGPSGDGGDGTCQSNLTVGANVTFGTKSWRSAGNIPYMALGGTNKGITFGVYPALIQGGANTAMGLAMAFKITASWSGGNGTFDNQSTSDGIYGENLGNFRCQTNGGANCITTTKSFAAGDEGTVAFFLQSGGTANCSYWGASNASLSFEHTTNPTGSNPKISQILRIGKASGGFLFELSLLMIWFDDYGSGDQAARTTDIQAFHDDPYGATFQSVPKAPAQVPWTRSARIPYLNPSHIRGD